MIDSAVISGRGRMRIAGIGFPMRYRFVHDVGRNYRHYIQTTIFGLRLLTINEFYLDGNAHLEVPGGVSEGAKIDQGANLALWAEDLMDQRGRRVGGHRRAYLAATGEPDLAGRRVSLGRAPDRRGRV